MPNHIVFFWQGVDVLANVSQREAWFHENIFAVMTKAKNDHLQVDITYQTVCNNSPLTAVNQSCPQTEVISHRLIWMWSCCPLMVQWRNNSGTLQNTHEHKHKQTNNMQLSQYFIYIQTLSHVTVGECRTQCSRQRAPGLFPVLLANALCHWNYK